MHLQAKIPPPVIFLFYAGCAWGIAKLFPVFVMRLPREVAGIFFMCGMAIAIHSVVGFIYSKTTFSPVKLDKSKALVVSGFYRISRNPMYLGMLCVLISWLCLLGNIFALPVLPLFILTINRLQILPEEAALEKTFGKEYKDYTNRVRRWL